VAGTELFLKLVGVTGVGGGSESTEEIVLEGGVKRGMIIFRLTNKVEVSF
jgi:hypothetical protein